MAHYLVTGGAGFIGSTLAKRLLAEGHQVRILDNLSTGLRERVPENAVLVEGDIRDRKGIAFAFEGIDGVFHCAAMPRVPLSIKHPAETASININGTLNVFLAARDAKVKRVVYSASSSAYGDQATYPLHTDLMPNPMNPYALQKYVGELHAKQFSSLYGLETVSLRYFNVYGPNMAEDGAYVTVIGVFKQQAMAGKSLTIEGDGEQTRDFTHVHDVVDANIRAMTSKNVGKGEVLNVGASEEHSIKEIAQMFGRPAVHVAPRQGDPRRTLADTTRTKELLGWKPKVAFTDGVNDLLKEWGLHPSEKRG